MYITSKSINEILTAARGIQKTANDELGEKNQPWNRLAGNQCLYGMRWSRTPQRNYKQSQLDFKAWGLLKNKITAHTTLIPDQNKAIIELLCAVNQNERIF